MPHSRLLPPVPDQPCWSRDRNTDPIQLGIKYSHENFQSIPHSSSPIEAFPESFLATPSPPMRYYETPYFPWVPDSPTDPVLRCNSLDRYRARSCLSGRTVGIYDSSESYLPDRNGFPRMYISPPRRRDSPPPYEPPRYARSPPRRHERRSRKPAPTHHPQRRSPIRQPPKQDNHIQAKEMPSPSVILVSSTTPRHCTQVCYSLDR